MSNVTKRLAGNGWLIAVIIFVAVFAVMMGLGWMVNRPSDTGQAVPPQQETQEKQPDVSASVFADQVFDDYLGSLGVSDLFSCDVDEVITVSAGSSVWATTQAALDKCRLGHLTEQAVSNLRQKDPGIDTVQPGYRAIVRSDSVTAQIVPLDANHYVSRLKERVSAAGSSEEKRAAYWSWYCTISEELFPEGVPESGGPVWDVAVSLGSKQVQFFEDTELPWAEWLVVDALAGFTPDSEPLCQ